MNSLFASHFEIEIQRMHTESVDVDTTDMRVLESIHLSSDT